MATSDRAAAGLVPGTGATIRTEDRAQRRERRIGEFQAGVRPRIASLTLDAPELEDLADSFPGLLFALAVGYNQGPAHDRVFTLLRAGTSLKHVSDTLGLAWWLRRLPASAFSEMMPRLPGEADFALRLGSFIPTDKRRSAAWLLGVSDAYLIGGGEFALWTARAWSTLLTSTPPNRAGLAAAWRWYSDHPGTLGHELLRGGWDPRLSASASVDEINAWLKRVALVEWLGTGQLEPWIPDAQVGPYEFRMLRRAEEFIVAARDLDNCLEQYAGRLANGTSSVAKIMKGGRTIACIEIGLHETDPSMPSIVQLRGHKNKRVPADLWRKAFDWLAHAPIEPFQAERLTPPANDRQSARQMLWGAYIAAIENHPDPAGSVAALRLRRTLQPRLKATTPLPGGRRRLAPPAPGVIADEPQPTMLQRVREHLATLTSLTQTEHELLRWDAIERLEGALRGRRRH